MPPDAALIGEWRRRLAAGRAEAIESYRQRPHASHLLRGLSRLTDRILAEIWAAYDLPAKAALVAVGGYGRGELYPQSDVDVLLLLADELNAAEHARFEPLIGVFWDVGLPIGHSLRTLSECTREAAADITVQTTMLEARCLAGSRALFRRMREANRQQLDPVAFFAAKLAEQQHRHGRQADVAMVLEPNLKECPGGLRDLHSLHWVARAAGFGRALPDLVRNGILHAPEARMLRAQVRKLAHLRIQLHLAARRREDRLLYEFQEGIAASLGVRPGPERRASERMMQAFFRAARHIRLINDLVLGEVRQRLLPPETPRHLPGAPGFYQVGNLLDAEESLFATRPEAVLDAFAHITRHAGLEGCTPRLLRALWRASRDIDARFRRNPDNQQRFLAVLSAPRGITLALRLMHRLELLGRYIPAFGRITGLMQHDQFHIYPVDEHTLMVLRNLRRLFNPHYAHEMPLQHRLMLEFPRPERLLLAALFHDIAKGRGGDHSRLGATDAARFCAAHGLAKDDAELVVWLVEHHLSLSSTAQKQDISDPEVIAAFAERCGTAERLTALYLLTVSDIRGTSPKIWNAWKDKLTRDLYLAARARLESGVAATASLETKKEAIRAQLRLYGFPPGAESALWARLDDTYFLRQDSRDIAWQTRRLLPLLPRHAHIVQARLAPVGEGVEVLVFSPDSPALFARICTFFAHMRYSILSARIHTTRDGFALNTFYALDPEHARVAYRDILSYIEHELQGALAAPDFDPRAPRGRVPRQLKAFPIAPAVHCQADAPSAGWLLGITAGDRPGLLAEIAWLLHAHQANVLSARINTLGNRAEDVFVIQGTALADAAKRHALEQALLLTLRLPD